MLENPSITRSRRVARPVRAWLLSAWLLGFGLGLLATRNA
jgi:hypothetical protein